MRFSVESFFKKYGFFLLLFLASVILLVPSIIRDYSSNGYLVGAESYYYLRLANIVSEEGFFFQEDALSYGGKSYVGERGWIFLLSFSPELLSRVLPFILGIGSFTFFYLFLKRFKPDVAELASFFYIISPLFIYFFTVASPYGFVFFLSSFGLYLLALRRSFFAVLSFGLISFFSFPASIFIFLSYLFYYLFKKIHLFSLLVFGLILIASFFLQFPRLFSFSFDYPFTIIQGDVFSYILGSLFSNFGSPFGVGLFVFILALLGMYSLWKNRYLYIFSYFVLLVFFWAAYYFDFLLYFIFIIFSFFSAYGFLYLYRRKWASQTLQHMTLFVLLCGFLFTPLSYINEFIHYPPDKSQGEAILYLVSLPSYTVFSYYSNGYFITYSGHQSITDSSFAFAPNVTQRLVDSHTIFYSNNLTKTSSLLDTYSIRYLWIDQEMKENLYNNRDVDLLALLKNNPQQFLKIFDNSGVEIWLYLGNDAI